uniref:Uncharacterized protein n=1 Tax=Nymphaea colorata TaxID=210225 RepID=A0A5K1FA90_9MAGN|nr:unnamed protein product [Nymphaea colorata]
MAGVPLHADHHHQADQQPALAAGATPKEMQQAMESEEEGGRAASDGEDTATKMDGCPAASLNMSVTEDVKSFQGLQQGEELAQRSEEVLESESVVGLAAVGDVSAIAAAVSECDERSI